jgi:hypothetical protein
MEQYVNNDAHQNENATTATMPRMLPPLSSTHQESTQQNDAVMQELQSKYPQ